MKTITFTPFLSGALLLLVISGCDLFGSDEAESGMLTASFAHYGNAQPVTLDQTSHTSEAGHTFTVTLLEYIITDLQLTHTDGSTVTIADAHYVNQDDPSSLVLPSLEVPPGRYTHVSFTFGIDGSENLFGNLERTTDFDNMIWPMMPPMGDGANERYHYMRFEGRYGTDGTFRIHVGPSGGGDYSFDVELPIVLEVDGGEPSLQIDMNLEQWLTAPNMWDFDDYSMIMGNAAAQSLLQENGATVFSIHN